MGSVSASRDWARRFYGLDVSAEAVAAIDESLTDRTVADLVDAHLGINYAYFGAIDKTLAGFVVLDSTGDDFTLLDVRDSGQVWVQDHETRELEVRAHALTRRTSKARRAVSSVELCARYQWLVWLLARPLEQHGAAIQDTEELVRNGIGRVRHVWPRRDGLEAAFTAELPQLHADPHLAIYWLLHATVFADHARRARVLEAIASPGPELLRAFVERFATLPLAGEVPVVPGFRARRALVQTYGETELGADDLPRACLVALEIDPRTSSLVHALQVTSGIERGLLTSEEVAAVVARIPEATTGTELLRSVLAKRGGAKASPHADTLARLIPHGGDPWWFALEAMWHSHELAYDGPALVAATRSIVTHDRYHRRALQMAMRAAQIANESEAAIDAIDADMELADLVLDPFAKLTQQPREWAATVGLLVDHPAATRALAWRVLQRVALNKPAPELAAWAAQQAIGDPDGIELIGDAFVAMEPGTQSGVVGAIASAIDGPDHPLVAILLACIDGPDAPSDFGAQLTIKRAKDAALVALAPWFHTPVLFDRLLELVERPAQGAVVDLVFAKLFNPFEKAHYLVPRLDAAQAVRAGKAMIATALRHPSIHARNAAGHQLYRFSPPAAEPFLVAALAEYSARFAAVQGPGGIVLDHGKTEHDQLEDLVANLYSAVRGLKTPSSREALLERLFSERRAYWRLGSALGEVWSLDLHRRALSLLAERRDAQAAGVYAFALHAFVKKATPLVELVRLVLDWHGETALARSLLHYTFVIGIEAALSVRDYALVRTAYERAQAITEPALEPDAHVRGHAWTDPLSTKPIQAALAAVLSGEAEAARAALHAAAAKSRTTRKPNKTIKDAALGELANAQVATRLLHDPETGEIWFRDTEGAVRYFDGFEVVTPVFTARPLGFEGVAAELTGATAMSDRALWWDAKLANFREAVRIGRHIRLAWGANNGSFERYLLRFPDEPGAVAAFAQLRAHPAPGFTESDPYYLPGKGAVVRTYYVREGTAEPQRRVIAVVDAMLEGVGELANEAAAIAEHAQRELGWLTTGGVLSTLAWDGKRRRRSDRTVREWIASRVRSDGRTAAWHLEALDEIARYLAAHRLEAPLETELGPPATPADIAVFAASRNHPVPEALDTLWRTISSARWQLGERGMRLLTPLEVLARRPIARAAAEAYMAKLSPVIAEQFAPLLKSLDVIVETLDGKPATFVADRVNEDNRVFTHAANHVNELWWEKSLGWVFATGLLHDLEDAIATAAPSVERLTYGAVAVPKKKKKKKPAQKAPVKARNKPKQRAAPVKAPTKRAKPKPRVKVPAKKRR